MPFLEPQLKKEEKEKDEKLEGGGKEEKEIRIKVSSCPLTDAHCEQCKSVVGICFTT